VVNALFASVPALGNVMLACLLFYLVFGIMAVNLFAVGAKAKSAFGLRSRRQVACCRPGA
jgi:hypothetical protein